MKRILFPALLLFLFSFSQLPAQTIRYVNASAFGGTSDGTSWANAFTRLQQALAVAQDGDQIWVAQGTYRPTTGTDRTVAYQLTSGVAVYGGFAGTETQLQQRDWVAYPTILSGDIGVQGDTTDNSFNIVYANSTNDKTRLDGLIIQEGNANNTDNSVDYHRPTRSGGGVYLDGEGFGYAQLWVVNCTFQRNRAFYQGGGMFANGREGGVALVRMENCMFERNISKTYGGGFSLENYFDQPFALEIKGCEFRGNFAPSGGIAVWLRANQEVTLTDCTFSKNTGPFGQTLYLGDTYKHFPLKLRYCNFSENALFSIWYYPTHLATGETDIEMKGCTFYHNELPLVYLSSSFAGTYKYRAAFSNCIFNSNGNGLSNQELILLSSTASDNKGVVSNCLFYNNNGIEITAENDFSIAVKNSIFITPHPFGLGVFSGISTYQVSNSLFNLSDCDSLDVFMSTVICDTSNLLGIDPQFTNPSNGLNADFHLQNCSPAINAGSNLLLDSLGISTDIEGNPRILNTVVDIGPYENLISLNPMVASQPSCGNDFTGSVALQENICAPYTFSWSNGDTTGTNLDSLAAGTYVFTGLSWNDLHFSDSVVIHAPSAITLDIQAHDAQCYGLANGFVTATASGGTPPYTYQWENPNTFSLPAGTYGLTVVDAAGCDALGQATIGSPGPIQFFYTVINTSGPNQADGAIYFDSITGGIDPPLPDPMLGLSPGNYSITLTDGAGCNAFTNIPVGFTVNAGDVQQSPMPQLLPNPTESGQAALLVLPKSDGMEIRVFDLQGRLLERSIGKRGEQIRLEAHWPPGVYGVEMMTAAGKSTVLRWIIF